MRLATPLVIVALLGLLAGCGGSNETSTEATGGAGAQAPAGAQARTCSAPGARTEDLRTTGAGCAEAIRVMSGWTRNYSCTPPDGASRSSCPLGSYRCLAAATDRGWSVSCAEPGKSVAFRFRRG